MEHTNRRAAGSSPIGRIMRHGLRGLAALLALTLGSPAAWAEGTPLKIGYSPIGEFLPAFVAKDQGIFARHGLDVEFVSVALNSNIPAALMSKSVDVGGPNVAVFLQAVDGGLDLVAVSGITQIPTKNAPIAFVLREDVAFDGAKSVEGRKIVMPGIGSSVDVLFRKWMRKEGADPAKVTYVELPSVQINDVLRGKSVDGAIVVQPFLTRVLQDKNGRIAARFTEILPSNVPAIIFAAQRSWATQNPKLLAAFQASIKEGEAFAKANPEKARASIGNYIKLPQPVLDSLPSPTMKAELAAADLKFWVDAMKSEKFLTSDLDPAALIAR